MTCHLSYTWSRSDRLFDGINEGMIFHAKFDRRHVANFFLDFNLVRTSRFKLSANTTLTFQSGHWETIQDGIVPVYRLAHLNSDSIDCMSSVNNYKMDDIFRWDVAICCEFICKNANHNLSLGVYNLLNRHNPFSLFYNPESGRWYSLSLIPIMPSLRYCISF